MSTKIIKLDVEELVAKELALANGENPAFRSPHEGYAVILEEVEELLEAVRNTKDRTDGLWRNVKGDDSRSVSFEINWLENMATNAACEAIQVAAMCRKYRESLLGGE